MKHISSFVHDFGTLENVPFDIVDYSRLKFGSDNVAKKFGYELALDFFNKFSDVLLSNKCVVIPSPYNHVKNAATVLTEHFINRLNSLLVEVNGSHVEYSVIHRKVSYISDYGFLSKAKRKGLIDNDSFYLNKDFYRGKVLIFIDDVRITGTHEDKLKEILEREHLKNDCFFLYYGNYHGGNPEVESQINFAAIKNVEDYIELSEKSNHHIIVRPIKFLLGLSQIELTNVISRLNFSKVEEIYFGCLGEGYYKIPNYQANFKVIKNRWEMGRTTI